MRRRSPLRNLLEYAAARLALGSLAVLPRPAAERLARVYTGLLDRALPRLRRVAVRNLSMALPELTDKERTRVVDGVFVSIAHLLASFAHFPAIHRQNISEWIRYDGYEHFEQALERGRGVLFATAHLGNSELSAFAHALLSALMHVMVRRLDNPWIDRLVEHRRTLSGNGLIEKKTPPAAS